MQTSCPAAVFDAAECKPDDNAREGIVYPELMKKLNDDLTSRDEDHACQEAWNLFTGRAMSQFEATYFSVVFAFLFPKGTGCPDMPRGVRERHEGSPRVDFVNVWSKLIAQRVESQFRTDPTFLFAVWNLVFRTIVNLGSNMNAICSNAWDPNVTAHDFKVAAVNIMQALREKYVVTEGT